MFPNNLESISLYVLSAYPHVAWGSKLLMCGCLSLLGGPLIEVYNLTICIFHKIWLLPSRQEVDARSRDFVHRARWQWASISAVPTAAVVWSFFLGKVGGVLYLKINVIRTLNLLQGFFENVICCTCLVLEPQTRCTLGPIFFWSGRHCCFPAGTHEALPTSLKKYKN